MILKFVNRTSRSLNFIQIASRHLNSKIPKTPVPTLANGHAPAVKVDRNTIALLERLSLVSYDTEEGVKILEDSIAFANGILHINTDDVEPLYSVLEDHNLSLREDKITQGNCQKEILKNAAVKEDDYFVAPIGNIPLHEVEVEQETTQSQENGVKFKLREPSQLLVKNIHVNWLQYNHIKSDKHHMPIFINELTHKLEHNPSTFGIVRQEVQDYDKDTALELSYENCALNKKSLLELDLIVPQQYAMQYLIQWQRYRKYWWSSISTTPSLFSTNEFKYENNSANVDIVAQLPRGQQPVEKLSFEAKGNENTCTLTCTMCLEYALFILLLDGLNNSANEEYLRLHRKIAPYKISIALDIERESINGGPLCKLASYLYQRLESNKISTWLPDFSLSLDKQIKESLRMGVTYTAILEENTLKFGIFKLMNSSTTLTEQVHVADFCKYAALISESGREVIV